MAVITVFNQKGGVGKTTTALNVTAALWRLERNPIAIDLDPQAHLTLASGLSTVPIEASASAFFKDEKTLAQLVQTSPRGWRIIPGNIDLSKIDALHGGNTRITGKLRAGLRESDLLDGTPILIDCCPMLGVLTLNAVLAADRVLMPVSPDFLSMQGAQRLDSALRVLEKALNRQIPRRIVVTRFDPRRRLSFQIYDRLAEIYGDLLCRTRISETVALAESPAFGRDIFSHAPNSPGARDYLALASELLEDGFFA